MRVLFYFHVLGATVWIGGLIVVAALVPAVRKATTDREVVRAVARRFGVVSWVALGVLVITGTIQALDYPWTRTLMLKVGLVLVSAVLAAFHTVMARQHSPAVRGAIQGVILILALVILWLAVNL